ncbi:Zn-ribbon domain-containing OB-fold protein [Ramlibacter sp.]|uniref:Zn-ribbon domain-containing OB-fold protein n=1 Tax=Ramlibacter sp. TaxID=1917967 RepID=UPI003D12D791
MSESTSALPTGLPIPAPENDGLSAPFWEGLREDVLRIQRCRACGTWQWGPEWICHSCHSFDMGWDEVAPRGRVYSWERVWHPVHPVLKGATPYCAVLVELPHAGNVRLLGNLLGDPMQVLHADIAVRGVFDHRTQGTRRYSLLNWIRTSEGE